MQVFDSFNLFNFEIVAAIVTFLELLVYMGDRVEWLVDVPHIMNQQSQIEALRQIILDIRAT